MHSRWLLTVLILLGLIAGMVVGQAIHDPNFQPTKMSDSMHAHATAVQVFYFIGNTVFLRLLKMLIVPLIVTSVVVGVTSVGDFRQLGRIGLATLTYFVSTLLIAGILGLVLVSIIRPGDRIGAEQRGEGEQVYQADVQEKLEKGPAPKGLFAAIQNLGEQIIPENIVAAAATGGVLPLIFFSIIFGIVVTTMGAKGQFLIDLFTALFEVVMKLVHGIIWLAPIGVFGLLAWTVARIGIGVFASAIGSYIITVLIGLTLQSLVVLPLIGLIFARSNPYKLMHQCRQALMTAFGTDSSSATLPVSLEVATEEAGISKQAAGFVLPLGSTINMDGTALYEAVAAVFFAQAYGIELSFAALVIVAITASLAAVGAPGIPSAGLVTMVIVVEAVNNVMAGLPGSPAIPIAAIGLIVGVDRILDMFRTMTNVWGDLIGAKIIDRLVPARQ